MGPVWWVNRLFWSYIDRWSPLNKLFLLWLAKVPEVPVCKFLVYWRLFYFPLGGIKIPYYFKNYLFIYLATPDLSWGTHVLHHGTWDLVPWPGIEPESHALGVWSLSHCPTREVLPYSKHLFSSAGYRLFYWTVFNFASLPIYPSASVYHLSFFPSV